MYYTYILYSKYLDKFYIGSAENVEQRLTKHITNHKGFTGKAKDWSVEYSEQFESKYEAQIRENQIKKWKSSAMIRDLVRNRK